MSSARSNNGWPPATSLRDQYQSLLTQLFTTDSNKKEPQVSCPLQTWGSVVIAELQQDKVVENGLTGTYLMEATTATTNPWDEIAPCSRKGWGWMKNNFPEMAFVLWWGESWWWGSSEPLQLRQPTTPWAAAARLEPTGHGVWSCPSTRHLCEGDCFSFLSSLWGPAKPIWGGKGPGAHNMERLLLPMNHRVSQVRMEDPWVLTIRNNLMKNMLKN